MADAESQKREQRQVWDESAAGWNKWWPTFERAAQPVNDHLVKLARIKPGFRVLDIATGNGEPAVTAARTVGASGRVVAVDQSPGMLAIARERAKALGISNIEFVESDAESMVLQDGSFDAAVCRWGLMFMPDVTGAVRKIRRALKPGSAFATAVWNTGDKVPMIFLAADTIRKIASLPAPPPDALGPTRLADTSILKSALERAGFSEVVIEPMIVDFEFESADQFVQFRSELGSSQAMMAKLTQDQRDQVKTALREAVRKFEQGNGRVRLPNETICFCARA